MLNMNLNAEYGVYNCLYSNVHTIRICPYTLYKIENTLHLSQTEIIPTSVYTYRTYAGYYLMVLKECTYT